jgi:hypothetical protein
MTQTAATANQILTVDGASAYAVEVITADVLGWHPGATFGGYFVTIELPERDAARVARELRYHGYGVTRSGSAD